MKALRFALFGVALLVIVLLLVAVAPVGAQFDPGDGRLNPDPIAPVALYCNGGLIEFYRINPLGVGEMLFRVTPDEISRVGIPPIVNMLIDHKDGVGIFRLTSGEFQVMIPTVVIGTPAPLQGGFGGGVDVPPPANGPLIHTVQRGENLFRISLRYNVKMDAIASANGIMDINRIFAGQQLIIPGVMAAAGTTGGIPIVPSTIPGRHGRTPGERVFVGFDYFFLFDGCPNP